MAIGLNWHRIVAAFGVAALLSGCVAQQAAQPYQPGTAPVYSDVPVGPDSYYGEPYGYYDRPYGYYAPGYAYDPFPFYGASSVSLAFYGKRYDDKRHHDGRKAHSHDRKATKKDRRARRAERKREGLTQDQIDRRQARRDAAQTDKQAKRSQRSERRQRAQRRVAASRRTVTEIPVPKRGSNGTSER